jgi:Protein of unknown function (DUF3043)
VLTPVPPAAAGGDTLPHVPSFFRRKSAELVEDPVDEVDEPVEPLRPRGYTPKKGEATPKRPTANRRTADAKPKDAKAARALARERRSQDARERREGLMAGDDRFLGPRDKGPVRRYVRDIVDARRNVGSIFFFGTVVVLTISLIPNFRIQLAGNLLFLTMLVAILFDSVLLARRITQKVNAKFPKHGERMGQLYFYAIMRALSFRRMRAPKPQVHVGAKV